MVFTYNIAKWFNGLALYLSFIQNRGRAGKEISAGAALLSLLCLVYYVFGLHPLKKLI